MSCRCPLPSLLAVFCAPEVFHAGGMDVAIHVGFGMVNDLVRILRQLLVRLQRVCVKLRSGSHVPLERGVDMEATALVDNTGTNPSSLALGQTEYDCLAVRTSTALDPPRSLGSVHVPRLASDEGFIGFNDARHNC